MSDFKQPELALNWVPGVRAATGCRGHGIGNLGRAQLRMDPEPPTNPQPALAASNHGFPNELQLWEHVKIMGVNNFESGFVHIWFGNLHSTCELL